MHINCITRMYKTIAPHIETNCMGGKYMYIYCMTKVIFVLNHCIAQLNHLHVSKHMHIRVY